MAVNVKDNNLEFALRRFKTEVAKSGTLSAYRDKLEYKKPGVRLREEKKQNIINSRRNNKKNSYSNRKSSNVSKRQAKAA